MLCTGSNAKSLLCETHAGYICILNYVSLQSEYSAPHFEFPARNEVDKSIQY
jgi:hypothetical protein